MVGTATFTIVWSSVFMSIAKQTTIRATQLRRSWTKPRMEEGMGEASSISRSEGCTPLIVTIVVSVKLWW